jgi:NADPH-dependent 2,4-dienoyl-CoA reductase/sulfur reductase-like enzyme/nitrite reductase/ring-hydroxylating ferredoxin subunit
MSDQGSQPSGPDLTKGVDATALVDGAMLLGHVGDDAVLLARQGDETFAIGAVCTHYSGPLADGLVVDDTVRCPLHHACFSLRTGEALRAPALDPVACWKVEHDGETIYVREKAARPAKSVLPAPPAIKSVVIVGAGGAGNAAAEMLRREGFGGAITMVSADNALPYDRPNLSKDFLAGNAPAEWIPLRSAEFYSKHDIGVRLNTRVEAVDTAARTLTLNGGEQIGYDALLLATGASPVQLDIPGADSAKLHYLRTLDDSRALIAAAEGAKSAVVIGASFIGLETAASLRERGLAVHVIGPQELPLERVLGAELGRMIKALHEAHGVVFHLGTTATALDDSGVTLKSGDHIAADLVVAGIGVRPDVEIAKTAGIEVDNGVLVDAYLQTNAPGVFAAGDIARWPDRHTGERIRVEHWVLAERQGQVAARNILGRAEPFDVVPFFWSQHYDIAVRYVGHAAGWDRIEIDGDPLRHDCAVSYFKDGRKVAVATVSRDRESLRAEVELEATTA